MIHDKDLHFLCGKIKQLRTAIFTNFSTALLKFPVSVVEVAATDIEGNVWFRITKPYFCIEDFEQSFPAQLHFYNKDINYRIEAHGKASIVDESEGVKSNILFNAESHGQYAIIKFRILHAEYFYYRKNNNIYFINFINNMVNKLLSNTEPILYRF